MSSTVTTASCCRCERVIRCTSRLSLGRSGGAERGERSHLRACIMSKRCVTVQDSDTPPRCPHRRLLYCRRLAPSRSGRNASVWAHGGFARPQEVWGRGYISQQHHKWPGCRGVEFDRGIFTVAPPRPAGSQSWSHYNLGAITLIVRIN